MAIWQFEVILIPITDLVKKFGDIPADLPLDKFKEMDLWTTVQPPQNYESYLAQILPPAPAYRPNAKGWGYDVADRIEVWYKNGRVSDVSIRIDLRKPTISFLQKVAELATQWNCIIQPNYECFNDLIEPEVQALLYAIRQHKASSELHRQGYFHEPFPGRPEAPDQRIFISYSSKDRLFVDKLSQDLKGNNINIWLDRWELKVGDSLTQRIQDGIDTSGWLLIVLSEHSVKSTWVRKELSVGLTKELELNRVFVLPVLIEDCDLPAFLRDKVYADFRQAYQLGYDAIVKAIAKS